MAFKPVQVKLSFMKLTIHLTPLSQNKKNHNFKLLYGMCVFVKNPLNISLNRLLIGECSTQIFYF